VQKQFASALNFMRAIRTNSSKYLARKYCALVPTRDFGNIVKIHH